MYGIIIISEGGACVCSSKRAPVPSEPASKFTAHRAVVPAIAWLLYCWRAVGIWNSQSCIKYSTSKYQYQYQWSKYQYQYQYQWSKYQYKYQYLACKYKYKYQY